MNNPLLTAAAWVIALALVVLAGISAYTTFLEEDEPPLEEPAPTWVEFQACFRSFGVDSIPGALESSPGSLRLAFYDTAVENCGPLRPIPFQR